MGQDLKKHSALIVPCCAAQVCLTRPANQPIRSTLRPLPIANTSNDLNSKKISSFWFFFYLTYNSKKHFNFIFTPSLHLPVAGSGNSALRAETKHDTHTARSHYTSNFPQTRHFWHQSAAFYELSFYYMCARKKKRNSLNIRQALS